MSSFLVRRLPFICNALVCVLAIAALGEVRLSPAYAEMPVVRPAPSHIIVIPRAEKPRAKLGVADQASTLSRALIATARIRLVLWNMSLEWWGIAWFFLAFVLELRRMNADADAQGRLRFYLFALCIPGLIGLFWSFREIAFQWQLIGRQYAIAIAALVYMFLVAAVSTHAPFRAVARNLLRDLGGLASAAPTWAAVAVFLLMVAARPAAHRPPSTPTGEKFEAWFAAQPRVPGFPRNDIARVVVVRALDYQCPPCQAAHVRYADVLGRLSHELGDAMRIIDYDFPLERECNPYVAEDIHPAACEAAVALRLARLRGRGAAFEDWLWMNQPTMTRETVFAAAARVGHVTDLADQYRAGLDAVRRDVEAAKRLGVAGTPTYFVNGVQLRGVSPADLEIAIRHELRSAGPPSGPSTVAR